MSGLIRRLQGSAKVFDRDPGLREVLAKLLDVLLYVVVHSMTKGMYFDSNVQHRPK